MFCQCVRWLRLGWPACGPCIEPQCPTLCPHSRYKLPILAQLPTHLTLFLAARILNDLTSLQSLKGNDMAADFRAKSAKLANPTFIRCNGLVNRLSIATPMGTVWASVCVSVCLSVRHKPELYQIELFLACAQASLDFSYTLRFKKLGYLRK